MNIAVAFAEWWNLRHETNTGDAEITEFSQRFFDVIEEAFLKGAKIEREACAKIVERYASPTDLTAKRIAKEIRERGETE